MFVSRKNDRVEKTGLSHLLQTHIARNQGNKSEERVETRSADTEKKETLNNLPLIVGWVISDIF